MSLNNILYTLYKFIHFLCDFRILSYGTMLNFYIFNSQQSDQIIALEIIKIFMLQDVMVCSAKYELQTLQLQGTLCFHGCSSFSLLKQLKRISWFSIKLEQFLLTYTDFCSYSLFVFSFCFLYISNL